jgi:signal transduction histidine kinase
MDTSERLVATSEQRVGWVIVTLHAFLVGCAIVMVPRGGTWLGFVAASLLSNVLVLLVPSPWFPRLGVATGTASLGLLALAPHPTPIAGMIIAVMTLASSFRTRWQVSSVWLLVASATCTLVIHPPLRDEPSALVVVPLVMAWMLGVVLRLSSREKQHSARLARSLAETNAELEAALVEAEQAAALRERARIALDLHDDLGAELTTLHLLLDRGADHIAAGRTLEAHLLAQSRQHAEQALTTLRRTVGALTAPDALGFEMPLRSMLRDLRSVGLEVQVTMPSRDVLDAEMQRLDATTRDALLRATREALTNISKHSTTTAASMMLRVLDADLLIEISDPGPAKTSRWRGGGLGVAGMKERLRAVGGAAIVTSEDAGWRVALRVPRGPSP